MRSLSLGALLLLSACQPRELQVVDASRWVAHTEPDPEPWGAKLNALHFKPNVCAGVELRPDYQRLDETSLMAFLENRGLSVRSERRRPDLVYVIVEDADTRAPVRLRVAILDSATKAGTELSAALGQHGAGSWGVHRSNLAVLGPVGDASHDLAFAAHTGLVCWGVFTIVQGDVPLVVPGGYREI